jgi:hypothetical protein
MDRLKKAKDLLKSANDLFGARGFDRRSGPGVSGS